MSNCVTIIINLQTRSATGLLILKTKWRSGRGCESWQQEWPGERGAPSGVVIRAPGLPSGQTGSPGADVSLPPLSAAQLLLQPRSSRSQGNPRWKAMMAENKLQMAAWWKLGRAD